MADDAPRELADLRGEIDEIDERIADLVAERTAIAEDVAAVKRRADRSLVDEDREETVVSRYEAAFAECGLGEERGRSLARFLIETSLEREQRVE